MAVLRLQTCSSHSFGLDHHCALPRAFAMLPGGQCRLDRFGFGCFSTVKNPIVHPLPVFGFLTVLYAVVVARL